MNNMAAKVNPYAKMKCAQMLFVKHVRDNSFGVIRENSEGSQVYLKLQ